ncbi:MAG: hypothetical protein R3B13_22790 [Polyangiaceae bacterium]
MNPRYLLCLGALLSLACGSTSADPIQAGTAGGAGAAGSAGSSGNGGSSGTGSGGTGGGGANGSGGAVSNPACNPVDAPASVVACNLPPDVAVVGAYQDSLYVVSTGRYLRVTLSDGKVSQLFKSTVSSSLTATQRALLTGFDSGAMYFSHYVDVAGGFSAGMLRTDGSTSHVVTDFGVQSGSVIALDATSAYFEVEQGLTAATGIGRVGRNGGLPKTLTTVGGSPLAVRQGYVFYRNGNKLVRRVSSSGGDSEIVVQLPEKAGNGVALDDSHLYWVEDGEFYGKHALRRTALTPPFTTELVANIDDQGGNFVSSLYLDGDNIYFSQYGGVQKLAKSGGTPESLNLWAGESPALAFDDQYVYVAYERGGDTSPIEGVIVRRPK